MIARRAALVLAALAAAGGAAALDPARSVSQLTSARYSTPQGLPQDTVRAMVASRSGVLWLGSDEGLARFDGARFSLYDRRSAPALGSNLVYALAEDEAGVLWIGTFDAGLYRLEGGVLGPARLPAPLPSPVVNALLAAPGGALWIGTAAGLVLLADGGQVTFGVAEGLPSAEVLALARAPDGRLWVGTAAGAAALEGRQVLAGPAALRGAPVLAVAVAPDGSTWFASAARGLVRLPPGGGALEAQPGPGLPSGPRVLYVDRHAVLWVGGEGGLVRLRDGRPEPVLYPDGHPAHRAWAMTEDREGNLWCGFEGEALLRLSDGEFTASGVAEGLPSDVAVGVLEDGRRDVWISTFGGLAVAPGGDSRRLRAVVRGTAVLALTSAGDAVLFGQSDGAIGRIVGGVVTWLAQPTPQRAVMALLARPGEALLAGTAAGLFRLEGGRLVPDGAGLPAGVRVNALALAQDGALWAGLERRGAWRRAAGGAFEQVAGPPVDRDVNDFLFDADGGTWLATLGAGLWHLRDGQARAVTTAAGLPDDTIWRVLDDRRGRLWLSSNRGVAAVARSELLAVLEGRLQAVSPATFGAEEGMRSRECNGGVQPAGWRGADGRLWFPTVKGVAVVDPARLRAPVDLPAFLDGAVVDGQERRPGPGLQLEPGTRRLQVAFGAPAFGSPEQVRFRYRLAGFDQDWLDARGERVATYTDLPPGRFSLEVQARSGAAAWGPPAVLAVERRPGLLERPWFWPSLAVLAAALGALAYAARVRRARLLEAELRRRVDEALGDVKRLEGLLPVCAWCKGARRDDGYWTRIEAYLQERGLADVTHALCPECQAKYFPEGGGEP